MIHKTYQLRIISFIHSKTYNHAHLIQNTINSSFKWNLKGTSNFVRNFSSFTCGCSHKSRILNLVWKRTVPPVNDTKFAVFWGLWDNFLQNFGNSVKNSYLWCMFWTRRRAYSLITLGLVFSLKERLIIRIKVLNFLKIYKFL